MTGRPFPVAAICVAVITCGALLFTDADVLAVLAALLVWIASLWLVPGPPPPASQPVVEGVRLSIQGMRDLIERSSVPMFVLDEDRVIVANAAAREVIGGHVVGQDARVAFRHPEAVALITDTVMEAARAGRSYDEARRLGTAVLSEDDVLEGVADLVDVVQVEALFDEGTQLVTLWFPIKNAAEPPA